MLTVAMIKKAMPKLLILLELARKGFNVWHLDKTRNIWVNWEVLPEDEQEIVCRCFHPCWLRMLFNVRVGMAEITGSRLNDRERELYYILNRWIFYFFGDPLKI